MSPDKCSMTKKCARKFSHANVARSKDSVLKIHVNWLSFVQRYSNLNKYFSVFIDAFNTLIDMHFPLRTIHVRDTEPSWMNVSLKLAVDDRDRAYRDKIYIYMYVDQISYRPSCLCEKS